MNIEIKLKHFEVPDSISDVDYHVIFPLNQIDANDLADLCDQFRKNVFAKAKKQDPTSKLRINPLFEKDFDYPKPE